MGVAETDAATTARTDAEEKRMMLADVMRSDRSEGLVGRHLAFIC